MAKDPWSEVFAEDCSRPALCPVKVYELPKSGLEPWVSEFDPTRGHHPEPEPKKKSAKGLFLKTQPEKSEQKKDFGRCVAWAQEAVVIDKLTGKIVAEAESVTAAGRIAGMSGGGASYQALNGTFGKGWYAVRFADSPTLPYPELNRPLILDDGIIKVAFANKQVAANALYVTKKQLNRKSVQFEGRECTIHELAEFINDEGIRRYDYE